MVVPYEWAKCITAANSVVLWGLATYPKRIIPKNADGSETSVLVWATIFAISACVKGGRVARAMDLSSLGQVRYRGWYNAKQSLR